MTGKIKINSRGLSVWLMTEDRWRKTDDRGQNSECGSRNAECGNKRPETPGQRTEDRGRRPEDGEQMAEGRNLNAEVGPVVVPKEWDFAAARMRNGETRDLRTEGRGQIGRAHV